jgi:pimeloyl-ACP methyl ester carboxylesterase
MPNTKTIRVPHLGGIDAAYQMPREYDRSKPTVVLVNAFTTSSELYRNQFEDSDLASQMNLVAIELLGHGQTRTAREHWTYWDTAEMNLQVLDALGIDRAFVLGTSQGGWITVQMALLRPEKVPRRRYPSEVAANCFRSLGLSPSVHPWTANRSGPDSCSAGMVLQS